MTEHMTDVEWALDAADRFALNDTMTHVKLGVLAREVRRLRQEVKDCRGAARLPGCTCK